MASLRLEARAVADRNGKGYTLDEIARELGYNKTTISRVISGKGRISEKTRQRVQAFIQERGFRPNALARSLANSRTYNLGVVVPRDAGLIESGFLTRCVTGICAAATERDFDVLMVADAEGELRRVLQNGKVEGVIFVRSLEDCPARALLKQHGTPYAVIGPADPGELSVDNDNEAACRALTAAVLGAGASRPALLGGEARHRVTHSRLKGFLDGCADRGVTPDPALIFTDLDAAGLDRATDALTAAGADAVFCMDEGLCALMMMRLKDRGVGVPGDLKVACFYDGGALEFMSPPVTAIRFDAAELGRRACERLLLTIEGGDARSGVIGEYRIIWRQSTGDRPRP